MVRATFQFQVSRYLSAGMTFAFLGVAFASVARAGETPSAGEARPPEQQSAGDEDATKSDERPVEHWIRLQRSRRGEPLAMQTAIVRYTVDKGGEQPKSDGPTVDLIGAVHVGDRSYYDRLNRRFKDYDALLFELVAPKGTVIEKGRGTSNSHPVGAIQNGLKSLLGLEHQLEHIDYTQKNFVHADMSPDEFSQKMEDRGESFLQMYFRLVGQEIARQSQQQADGKFTELDLFSAFFSRDRDRRIKIALAQQFEDMEGMLAGFGGPDGSTIITERNRVALEVLSDQLKDGKKKLGIFYGAGHLSDMDERLRKDFRMKPVQITWVDAWNLRP